MESDALDLNDPLWDDMASLEVTDEGICLDFTLQESEFDTAMVLDTRFTQPTNEFRFRVARKN